MRLVLRQRTQVTTCARNGHPCTIDDCSTGSSDETVSQESIRMCVRICERAQVRMRACESASGCM
eukprot:3849437-Pleurochrysis_carterae.AAC.2